MKKLIFLSLITLIPFVSPCQQPIWQDYKIEAYKIGISFPGEPNSQPLPYPRTNVEVFEFMGTDGFYQLQVKPISTSLGKELDVFLSGATLIKEFLPCSGPSIINTDKQSYSGVKYYQVSFDCPEIGMGGWARCLIKNNYLYALLYFSPRPMIDNFKIFSKSLIFLDK